MHTDEQTVTQIAKLLEQTRGSAYSDGYNEGRASMLKELTEFFARWANDEMAGRPRTKRTRVAEPEVPQVESIEDAVLEALSTLAEDLKAGVEPQAIAEFFKSSPLPLDIKQVRAALRALTMDGEVHRVADGRYLPGPASEPAAPVAETVAQS